ncbi:MAG: DUF5522 domain-containing protein [Pseudomonadota bacterium]|nr:DUF5522 domain-containing protein [Pseudomonadota bacterium]
MQQPVSPKTDMSQATTPKTCTRCEATFSCSGCQGGACWCMQYPPIFSCTDPNADCVCPACMTAQTQAHIAATIDTCSVHQYAPAQALACQHLPLIEGLDYQIESGRWVLSRWYLLKRGECCGNACRNCPYGHRAVPSASQ